MQTKLAITGSTSLQIPGNGKGSSLTIVDTIDIASHTSQTRVVVDDTTNATVGRLLITHDGFWATVVAVVNATTLDIDKWKNTGGVKDALPAVGTNVMRVFPAGSILAGCQAVEIEEIAFVRAITATRDFVLHDFGSAALHTIPSVVGQQAVFDMHCWRLPSPFMYSVSNTSELTAHILFKVM